MGRRKTHYLKHVAQFVRKNTAATVGLVTGRICSSGSKRKAQLHDQWATQAGVKK